MDWKEGGKKLGWVKGGKEGMKAWRKEKWREKQESKGENIMEKTVEFWNE